jgi:hypothetical protein
VLTPEPTTPSTSNACSNGSVQVVSINGGKSRDAETNWGNDVFGGKDEGNKAQQVTVIQLGPSSPAGSSVNSPSPCPFIDNESVTKIEVNNSYEAVNKVRFALYLYLSLRT